MNYRLPNCTHLIALFVGIILFIQLKITLETPTFKYKRKLMLVKFDIA